MKTAPLPRPDEATLRAVYAREAPHRPHWPRTYEAAAADPLTAAILRALAHTPPSFGRRAAPAPPAWNASRHWHAAPSAQTTRQIDFKSRAAGEKPEPDDTQ